MKAVIRLAVLGMVLSLDACGVFPPQVVKQPTGGQRIAVPSLNVAVLVTPLQTPFPYDVMDAISADVAKYVAGELSASHYAVEGKELRLPAAPANLSGEFPGSSASSFYLVIRRIRAEARCAHGHCGVSTYLKASLLAPSGQEQYAAIFHFGSRDSDAPKDDYVRQFSHVIAKEILRVTRPA